MTKIYSVVVDDSNYDSGCIYDIGCFINQDYAEELKHKVEQVFYYVEQRSAKLMIKYPNLYETDVARRLFNCIKRNPNYKYLAKVNPSYWYSRGPIITIEEQTLYNDLAEYPKGYN